METPEPSADRARSIFESLRSSLATVEEPPAAPVDDEAPSAVPDSDAADAETDQPQHPAAVERAADRPESGEWDGAAPDATPDDDPADAPGRVDRGSGDGGTEVARAADATPDDGPEAHGAELVANDADVVDDTAVGRDAAEPGDGPPPDGADDGAGGLLAPDATFAPDTERATPVEEPVVPAAAHAAPPPPSAFARPLPRVLAIANQKGGVGKTTTAVNLSAALAELGYRVLVVDLDPQGNATTGLGINPRNLESSIYDVILHDVPLEDCIEPTSVRNLFVAPATIDLAGAEIELVPAFSRELRLKKAIGALDGEFDFTVIDCPPSLGLLTVNGLAAATEVVVPIQCEYYALEGLGQLLRNVNLVQGNLNPTLEVSAIVLTMFDGRTKLSDQVVNDVRTHFGSKVCRNIVPRTVRLSEAPSFGQPVTVFDPMSRGAIAYRELAKEVSGGAPQRTG